MLKKTAKDFIESENKSRKQTYYKRSNKCIHKSSLF